MKQIRKHYYLTYCRKSNKISGRCGLSIILCSILQQVLNSITHGSGQGEVNKLKNIQNLDSFDQMPPLQFHPWMVMWRKLLQCTTADLLSMTWVAVMVISVIHFSHSAVNSWDWSNGPKFGPDQCQSNVLHNVEWTSFLPLHRLPAMH